MLRFNAVGGDAIEFGQIRKQAKIFSKEDMAAAILVKTHRNALRLPYRAAHNDGQLLQDW